MGSLTIVHVAVAEDQLHVLDELPHAAVLVLLKVFLNRTKVHGLFNYIIIVSDLLFDWVHRLIEDPSLGILHEGVDHPNRDLLPMVVDWHGLIDLWHLDALSSALVLEELADLGVILSHGVELLLRHWAVLHAVENLEDIFLRLELLVDHRLGLWLRFWRWLWIRVLEERILGPVLDQRLLHVLAVVSDSKVDQALSAAINDLEINSKLEDPVKHILFVAFDGVINGCLLVIVDVVMFRAVGLEHFAHLEVS